MQIPIATLGLVLPAVYWAAVRPRPQAEGRESQVRAHLVGICRRGRCIGRRGSRRVACFEAGERRGEALKTTSAGPSNVATCPVNRVMAWASRSSRVASGP